MNMFKNFFQFSLILILCSSCFWQEKRWNFKIAKPDEGAVITDRNSNKITVWGLFVLENVKMSEERKEELKKKYDNLSEVEKQKLKAQYEKAEDKGTFWDWLMGRPDLKGSIFCQGIKGKIWDLHGAENWAVYDVPLKIGKNEITCFYSEQTYSVSKKVTVYYQPNNNPPLAKFSASPTTGPAPLNVHFDASASTDSDGTIASFEWAFADGTTGTGKIINHTFTTSNNYAVKLTVKDNLGATATKTMNISVTGAANLPPIADFSATPTSGTIPLNVHFDASASSDFDGSIVSYEWKMGNGNTRIGKILDYTYTQSGIFTVELKVKDNKGATATKTLSIDAQPIQNAQPIADFFISPPFGEAPLNTSINASASHDPDGGNIVQYHFNFGDGQTLVSTLPVVAHTYTIPNTYQVKLKVLDNEGVFSEEKIVSLTVALPNVMPVAVIKASSTSGFAPLTVHFDGRDSHDDDGSIASYQWTFPGGVTANTAEADFTFTQVGTFQVSLKVTSADSFTDTKSISIEVGNDTIKPSLSFDPEDGTKLITNVPLITVFYDDAETGINPSSLSVILDGTDVTNKFQVSNDRATLQFTNDYPLPHGAHTFQISIADNNGNAKSLEVDVSVDLGIIEQAYFVGHVQDVSGGPIAGATVTTILNPIRSKLNGTTDTQGNYKIPFTTAGNYQLQISKAGFTTSIRNVTAILARDAAVETAVMMVADTLVTPILASTGGNAANSSGTISINIPAGALNSDIQFSSTQATTGIGLTRPLPPLSHFTMAMDNQPSGTVFSTAADMSIANTLGFSPGTPVPYGIIDETLGLWIDSGRIGVVSNDGTKINFKADHFSQYDLNYPHDPKEDYEDTDPEDEDDSDDDCEECGSRINTRNGSLGIDYSLPSVKRFGKTYGLNFTYQSSSAHPQALLQVKNGRDITRTLGTNYINARLRLASRMELNFLANFYRYSPDTLRKPSLFRTIISAINSDNIAFNTGSYEFNAQLASVYTDGEYATASYFGGPAENPTGVSTLEPVQLGSELFSRVIVLNELYSPFGAGWTLNGQEKLAEDPEGTVVWTDGTGRSKIYKPLSGPQGGKLEKINLDGKNLADIHNMIYYKGYYYAPDCKGNVVYRIDLQGNSTILAGNGDPQVLNCPMSIAPSKRGGFFIADSGNARIVKVDPSKKIFKVVAGEKSAIGNPVWVSEDDVMAVHFITGDDIKIISPHNGEVLTYTTKNGGYVPADLSNPTQIHYDRFGNLYVVDSGNNRIMKMVTATRKARPIFGGAELLQKKIKSKKYDPNEPQLNHPVAMSFDPVLKRYFILEESGRVLHWDGIGHQRLVVLDMAGNKIKHSFKKFNKENSPEISALAYSPESGIAYADDSGVVITRLQNKTRKDKRNFVGEMTYVSPTREYSTLIKKEDGTFERLELDKTVKKYNTNGLMTDVLPLDGLNLHYTYGVGNRLATLTIPGGDVFTFEYGGSGHLDRVIDPAGRVTEFSVNSSGDLISIAAPNGDERQFSYNPAHLMTSQTDELNRVTAYQYTEGKLTGQTYPGNRQRAIMPSSLVGTTNLLKKQYKEELLPRIRPSDIKSTFTSPEGRTNAVEVDRFGAARAYINGLGKARYVERDSQGQATLETTEAGRIVSEKAYNLVGNPTSIIDESGKTTVNYDFFLNKPTQIQDEKGANTSITYNSSNGKVQTIFDPRGGLTQFAYFAGGVIQTITDANGKVTSFEINSQGNTTAMIDALGNRTEYTFDSAGNKTSEKDPEGNVTTYEFDLLNRLTKTIDPIGGITTFTYFADGSLKNITDGKGNTTEYSYGINGEVETVTNPASQVEDFVYDNDKNLIQKTLKDGSNVLMDYDAANQLTKESYADNVIDRIYSDDGLLERVTDNDSDLVMDYDDKQRVVNVVQSNAPTANLEYGYNALGLKTVMSFSNNMIKANYSHDQNQEVVTISGTIFGKNINWNRSLDILSRPTSEGRSNGLQSQYSFDDVSRIQSLNNEVSQYDYTYSDNGNITQILETIEGLSSGGSASKTHSFNYDTSNRLTQADSYKNESFVMDLLGNIINQSQIYNNLNQLAEDQNYFYSYDQRGNLSLISSKIGTKKIELAHNKQNLLTSVIIKNDGVNASVTISYKHDGLKRRIERAVVNHLEPAKSYLRKFIYDEEDIIAELDENNKFVAGYLHGPGIDNPIAMVRDHNGNGRFEDNEVFYFTKDHLGSVRELTDKDGNVVQRYRYSAYGETTIEKANPSTQHKIIENRYAFTGRELEFETGFYNFRPRTFIPAMKLFGEIDPIGLLSGDLNMQRYVKNRPINENDPYGTGPVLGAICYSADLAIGIASGVTESINANNEVELYQQQINDFTKDEKCPSNSSAVIQAEIRIKKQQATLNMQVASAKSASALATAFGGTVAGAAVCKGLSKIPFL